MKRAAGELEGQMTIEMFLNATIEESEAAQLLTLSEVSGLKMRTPVWIEERKHPWETDQSEVQRFFRLFPAKYSSTGIPIGKVLRNFHFHYVYHDRHTYDYKRSEAFYGSEWRVWIGEPTDAQREAEPWRT